jgi:hypothetical protein
MSSGLWQNINTVGIGVREHNINGKTTSLAGFGQLKNTHSANVLRQQIIY